jgi:hypothetical protein
MALDKVRLNRLHKESRALLESLADRLPPERLKHLRTFSDVGEWGELVESMCADLVKGRIPVTPDERDALASVLAIYPYPGDDYPLSNNSDDTLAALNVV